jgi:hypothetical protein
VTGPRADVDAEPSYLRDRHAIRPPVVWVSPNDGSTDIPLDGDRSPHASISGRSAHGGEVAILPEPHERRRPIRHASPLPGSQGVALNNYDVRDAR